MRPAAPRRSQGESVVANVSAQVSEDTEPVPAAPEPLAWLRHGRSWPIALLAAPAFVAIWSGWVGLGGLTGFGLVHPLPASGRLHSQLRDHASDRCQTYAAYALRVWLAVGVGADDRVRRFTKWSAVGALVLGAAGQSLSPDDRRSHFRRSVVDHHGRLLPARGLLRFGAALAHLQHPRHDRTEVGR